MPQERQNEVDLGRQADFAIGALTVRPSIREVRWPQGVDNLEPRVMQVLVALSSSVGEVVTRDDLVATCWGGRIVGEDAIQRAVARVRKLGDETGCFSIETIARIGYRMNAEDCVPRVEPVPAQSAAVPERVLERPAVAILPFVNMSGHADQEYFADGITEDLITALAAWRWFPVIARNSTFVYKGRAVNVTEVGNELGARYLVEGSVRRVGERVRINAQLIEVSTAHHIWARTYDREIGDVFAVQDEITRAIVGAIEPELTRAEQQRALRKLPERLDAWDLSLQALALVRRGTVRSLADAESMLTRATTLDQTSSYAQSLLALTRFQAALFGWMDSDPKNAFTTTYDAAREAVVLDESDWLAHALLGIATLWSHGDYDRALAEEEMAIALNPSAAMAYHFHGCVLTFNDQPAEALPQLEAVLRLDPRFQLLPTTLADLGLIHFLLGNHDLAVKYCDRSLGEQQNHVRAMQRKTATLAVMGRLDEAQALLAQIRDLQPDFSAGYLRSTYPFRSSRYADMFEDGLRRAGWNG